MPKLLVYGYLLLTAALFLPHTASANCAFMGDENATYDLIVEKVYAPIHDGGGTAHPGCIVESGNKIIGYTPYDFICRLKPDEKIAVHYTHGCCDSGPDSGDLVCTVRVKSMLGLEKAHGNGIGIAPAQMDARAIDDLVATLGGDYIFSYYGAATRFASYLSEETFSTAARTKKPDLQAIRARSQNVQQRGMVAYTLLMMGGNTDSQDAQYIVDILDSEPVFEDIIEPALARASALPGQASVFGAKLVYYLKRKYYDTPMAALVFDTMEKLGPALRPYIADLLAFEAEWAYRGAHYDFDQRMPFYRRMNRLVCQISAEDVRTLPRTHEKYNADHAIPRFACPAPDIKNPPPL